MPAVGLDPSFQSGLNQAVAQDLIFGKDIVFTFGPYASIYTRVYHPATDSRMVFAGFFLALTYLGYFILLGKTTQIRWPVLLFIIAVACLRNSIDALLFAIPLLAGMSFYSYYENGINIPSTFLKQNVIILLFFPIGLLPLIKGSLLFLTAFVTILSTCWLMFQQKFLPAVLCLTSPLVSFLIFWVMAGQPALAGIDYLAGILSLTKGYSEAMSSPGQLSEVCLFLLVSLMILIAIWQNFSWSLSKSYFGLLVLTFLFLAFKAGFVRHDSHAIASAFSILLAAILLSHYFKKYLSIPLLFLSFLAWHHIDSHYSKSSLNNPGQTFFSFYNKSISGAATRLLKPDLLQYRYDTTLAGLRSRNHLPVFPGTSDIYSYNQSGLIASGNKWSPRPVFQSYTVYTPDLAKMNKEHLLGTKAPEHIFLGIEPIDKRLPSLEDGPSWPLLLQMYMPIENDDSLIILKHIPGSRELPMETLMNLSGNLGIPVKLPEVDGPLFARVEIRSSVIGLLSGFLYKPTTLYICMELKDGTRKQFRFPSGMAESGFILSPLVENSQDFYLLYGTPSNYSSKTVTSITVTSKDVESLCWQSHFLITVSRIGVSVLSGPTITKMNKGLENTN